jgi:hypothetical protein
VVLATPLDREIEQVLPTFIYLRIEHIELTKPTSKQLKLPEVMNARFTDNSDPSEADALIDRLLPNMRQSRIDIPPLILTPPVTVILQPLFRKFLIEIELLQMALSTRVRDR